MKIIERFMRPVVTATPAATLANLARLMEEEDVGAVVITENHRPVGIVTDRDLALALGAHGSCAEDAAARVMSSPALTVNLTDGVLSITETMHENHIRRLPVVDDEGILVGIVTADDLLRVLGREMQNLAEGIAPVRAAH